jgi:CDGSH-type Zn-finger protein
VAAAIQATRGGLRRPCDHLLEAFGGTEMGEIRIKTLKDGPYEVKGAIQLVDANRAEFKLAEDPIYLCRCGHSASKPFCDGSHKRVGFKAEEPAR